MRTCRTVGTLAAASFISIAGQAAHAEITAQQVWDDWQAYLQNFGYTVEAQETESAGGLTVSDISMSFAVPEEDVDIRITMSEMTLTNRGDGSVSVTMPEVMPLVIQVDSPDDEDVEVALDYTTRGFEMIIAGDAEAMTYTYASEVVGVALTDLTVEGEKVDIGTANFEIADMAGTAEMTIGNLRKVVQTLTAGPVTYAMDIKDPEGTEGRMVIEGRAENLKMQGTTTIPVDMDMADMAAAMKAGFGFEGGYEIGPGSTSFDFQDAEEAFQGTTSSDGGNFDVAMDSERLRYAAASRNLAMEFTASDLPFPVGVTLQEATFDLGMPLGKSEEPQDFALSFAMRDFTMSDMIWALFDPEGKLPRDPATLALDLSGKASLLVDIFDAAEMEAVEDGAEMPGELQSLALNNLEVRAAGAELTGKGEVEIDNTDMTSYDGMPKPVGAVNLGLVGANALLDKLVEMGLLSNDDAMGARMMMGLFAVAGDGEDTLTSEIRFTEDGQVLANGQRLK